MADGALLGLSGEVRHTGERFFGLSNLIEEEAYTVINAQAFYEFGGDSQYRLSLWAKNLADEEYLDNRNISPTRHSLFVSDPRTYGVTFNMQF